jgi:hypothetical protein
VCFEEDSFLAELVELGIAIQEPGGDELIENSQDKGWHGGEDDVEERQSPGFVDDLAGEGVLEGVPKDFHISMFPGGRNCWGAYQNCVMNNAVFL